MSYLLQRNDDTEYDFLLTLTFMTFILVWTDKYINMDYVSKEQVHHYIYILYIERVFQVYFISKYETKINCFEHSIILNIINLIFCALLLSEKISSV